MKTVLSVNIGSKGFAEEYTEACKSEDVLCIRVRSARSCLTLEGNVARWYHQGEEIDLRKADYIFVRVAGKYTLMTSLITQLAHANRVPINEYTYLEHTQNEEKITQMLQLTLANLPIPRTVLFTLSGFVYNRDVILSHVSLPAVLKTNGSKGRNVWKIDTLEELERKIQELRASYEVAMLQELVPNTHDIRALYVYGDIIGAIKRSSSDGFYNNVSHGGIAEAITLTKEEKKLTQQSCEVLQVNFAGVDIVRTPKGPVLFEVNLSPQIYGFEKATGCDVPKELVKRIKKELGRS